MEGFLSFPFAAYCGRTARMHSDERGRMWDVYGMSHAPSLIDGWTSTKLQYSYEERRQGE
jgi:hypothetical protein